MTYKRTRRGRKKAQPKNAVADLFSATMGVVMFPIVLLVGLGSIVVAVLLALLAIGVILLPVLMLF